jgi:hypothetical protein
MADPSDPLHLFSYNLKNNNIHPNPNDTISF